MVSSKLSPLQHAFVDAFFSEPSSFFLTGGGALAGFHLGHRTTDDLDLFSPPVETMELAVQRLRRERKAVRPSSAETLFAAISRWVLAWVLSQ